VDEAEFKLSGDDTMRRLRTIAQSPGELAWRLELVATLERMRVSQEIATRALIQSQKRLKDSITHLSPMKLAELINAQIEQKAKERDAVIYRKGRQQVLHHIVTAAISLAIGYVAWRMKK
jgi:hypothetical protein